MWGGVNDALLRTRAVRRPTICDRRRPSFCIVSSRFLRTMNSSIVGIASQYENQCFVVWSH